MNPRVMKLVAVASAAAAAVIAYVIVSQLSTAAPVAPAPVPAASVAASSTAASSEPTSADSRLTTQREKAAAVQTHESAPSADGDASDSDSSGSSSSGSSSSTKKKTKPKTEDPKPVPAVELTLEQRKACYWDLIAAEDRAVAEAEKKYPLDAEEPKVNEHLTLRFSLTEKYQAEVAEEFGISVEQAAQVMAEGTDNQWPMPPLPE